MSSPDFSHPHSAAGLRATTTLNNSVPMPWFGLGVWQIRSDAETERIVCQAIERGYRSIDTARIYGNERGVGAALRHCGVPREQLFITTKVWNDDVRQGRVGPACEDSLRALGLDYVDLYLVHWPIAGQLVPAWRAMEALARAGRARAIGVSNHLRPHLDEVLAAAEIVPAVNQIEFHPYLQSRPLREFCRARQIRVEAWSPLQRGGELLADRVVVDLARQHGKTPAQVVLRWDLQHGVVTIPKSARPDRLTENADIFDFSLSAGDMSRIDALERNARCGPDPINFSF